MGHWVESDAAGSQTSLLVDPADGKLPAMTPWAQALYKNGRSSWVTGQPYDWVERFRHLGPLRHPRLPGLDAAVPLQQRHPRQAVARATS